jgi:ABC-type lipoprotein export system ATPase subunit
MYVVARDVEVSFPGRPLVAQFDASVPSGALCVIVGPSGSGKSTLLAALSGYRPVQAGTVQFRYADGTAASPLRSLVAWVPQGIGALGARSALDNVAIAAHGRGLGREEAVAVAHRCLRQVGLEGRADDPCGRLSGGERQRVALARALATDRPVLFADEPTSNLDAASTTSVIEVLEGLRGIVTVVVATHDPLVVAASDLVYDLRDGRRAP